jgi:hypothetical protein
MHVTKALYRHAGTIPGVTFGPMSNKGSSNRHVVLSAGYLGVSWKYTMSDPCESACKRLGVAGSNAILFLNRFWHVTARGSW